MARSVQLAQSSVSMRSWRCNAWGTCLILRWWRSCFETTGRFCFASRNVLGWMAESDATLRRENASNRLAVGRTWCYSAPSSNVENKQRIDGHSFSAVQISDQSNDSCFAEATLYSRPSVLSCQLPLNVWQSLAVFRWWQFQREFLFPSNKAVSNSNEVDDKTTDDDYNDVKEDGHMNSCGRLFA